MRKRQVVVVVVVGQHPVQAVVRARLAGRPAEPRGQRDRAGRVAVQVVEGVVDLVAGGVDRLDHVVLGVVIVRDVGRVGVCHRHDAIESVVCPGRRIRAIIRVARHAVVVIEPPLRDLGGREVVDRAAKRQRPLALGHATVGVERPARRIVHGVDQESAVRAAVVVVLRLQHVGAVGPVDLLVDRLAADHVVDRLVLVGDRTGAIGLLDLPGRGQPAVVQRVADRVAEVVLDLDQATRRVVGVRRDAAHGVGHGRHLAGLQA